jgi:heme-degrading monooxygenase HmoA
MIARHWRGWTKHEDADGYEALLKNKVLPGLKGVQGYKGGYILRKEDADETEFVVINLFASIETVKKFAGSNYEVAVIEPEAKAFLSRIENFATHYEVRAQPA